ncbi:unnamed protein product [Phyllotreta striolata]|uniref:Eukaryotic translation initiation factor 3 subunit J n=1 Tax=Phyllotreta striolata TaxID=444603 RepID=A0A9P0E084_PHYSR|nr:unnamed protein product [Phyllotreta striolata]
MASWDDENFEPVSRASAPVVVPNKWEGEDEDDDVKESWEDEDEEKKEEAKSEVEVKKPKKKNLAEKLAEKERLKKEELERKRKEEVEEEISPEERLRLQKESDLQIALATTFGDSKTNKDGGILFSDLSLPNTKEDFDVFAEELSRKLVGLSKNVEYPNFVENLSRSLCATMSSLDIKKVKNSLDNLFLEKQKIEKGDKSKKNKGKGKAKLHVEGDNQLSQLSAYVNDFDEYDDFM